MSRLMRRLGDQEFAVIGLGRFGWSLAVRLEETGHSVLGIDRNPEIVQQIANLLTETVALDATNEEALNAAGITEFNTVIVAIGDDFEAAALCVATLKEMGVPNVIARAISSRHNQLLHHIGADRVVQPLQDAGERLAEELGFPTLLKQLDLGPEHIIAQVAIPEGLIGKRLGDLTLREEEGVNILLIHRGADNIISPPPPTILQAGDILVVLGPTDSVLALADS